jgi:hypothetical protein
MPPPGSGSRTNGMAIASLVCGITGFFCGVTAVLAIIFGFISKRQIRDTGSVQGGNGMATAGIVLGCIVVALVLISIIAAVAK